MKNFVHRSLALVGLLGLALTTDGWHAQAAFQRSIEKSFQVAPGGQLTVRAVRGSIEVASGGEQGVEIEIVPRNMDLRELEDSFEIRFNQSGDDVDLEIESRGRISRWFNWGRRSFRVIARVPERYDVDLKTSGGSISVDDLTGRVLAATSGGSLSFGRITGPVEGRTSGGSIRLSESSGEAQLKTSGGSIVLGDVSGDIDAVTSGGSIKIAHAEGNVRVRTSGGSISVDEVMGAIDAKTSGGSVTASISRQPQSDCYLGTSGGNVTVHLAGGLNLDVDARSSGGRVRADVSVNEAKVTKRSLRGRINRGGPRLVLRTSGGSVRIREMK